MISFFQFCLEGLKVSIRIIFNVYFRTKFPAYADSQALKALEKKLQEIHSASESGVESEESTRNSSNSTDCDGISEIEEIVQKLKKQATDFKLRFCGHCNTTTDIKEANFFGR